MRILRLIQFVLFLFICSIHYKSSFAQANDQCSGAIDFSVTNNGFGLGLFSAPVVDITNASVQTGEVFAPAIFVSGQNKKSVWYKFSIATKRAVRVTLVQSGVSIPAGDVGFAVYKSDSCLPSLSAISTKLTPIDIFGNTFNPCVDPGNYLIQVSSKQNTSGAILVQLEVDYSTSLYDRPINAHHYGTLQVGLQTVQYDVNCQSIEDSTELCAGISGPYKTSWHVFTTPSYFDYIAFFLASKNDSLAKGCGYKLYQGDVRTSSYTGLPVLRGCDSLTLNRDTADWRTFKCNELDYNTTYSLQFFFHENFEDSVRLGLMLGGASPTQSPLPDFSVIPASNDFGSLPYSISGITTNRNEFMACNARHSTHPCLPAMPDSGINEKTLSAFFKFNLPINCNLNFEALGIDCLGDSLYVRVFKSTSATNCSSLNDSNKVAEFYRRSQVNCLPPGDYIIQVMGNEKLRSDFYYLYDTLVDYNAHGCLYHDLASAFNMSITASSLGAINNYSLNVPGAFDSVNSMMPLVQGVPYQTNIDTFGCSRTVLPFDSICPYGTSSQVYDRVIYRQFTVADSGVAGIYYTGLSIPNKIYKGNADSLALWQNAHLFPDSIYGLQPVTYCMENNESFGNRACVTPGTYTTCEFGAEAFVGPVWNNYNPIRPYSSVIVFTKNTTTHYSPETAEDMGDILSQLPATGGSVSSSIDYFTCITNADTLQCGSGTGASLYPPCLVQGFPANKVIYREFYLRVPASISIFSGLTSPMGYTAGGTMSLFYGKISDTSSVISPVPQFDCTGGSCISLPRGWYSVVSYGIGPSFYNPTPTGQYQNSSLVGFGERVVINVCPSPKYNRPYKAAIDTVTNQPFLIQYGLNPGSNPAFPDYGRYYSLYEEIFSCYTDTPFSSHPINPCGPNSVKVAYYVFRLTQEAFLKIYTYLPTSPRYTPMWSALYNSDIRLDSSQFLNLQPIQPCIYTDSMMVICRAQPGVYTLAVFYPQDANCINFTPHLFIDSVGISRFDYAAKAYDFSVIPPDSTFHFGRIGDVNPFNSQRAPSNDFFFCTTGARRSDPGEDTCRTFYSSRINDSWINNYLFPDSSLYNQYIWDTAIPRRNLWYSFVVNQGGTVRVKVQNKSPHVSEQPRFSIYRSNADGTVPFDSLVANGLVDSTYLQGLTFVVGNKDPNPGLYCSAAGEEASFFKDPCFSERFFILVTNKNPLNSQVEVAVLLDSISDIPKGDFCSNPIDLNLVGPSTGSSTVNVTCHTIGTDYGELYPTLTCPPGAITTGYKSSWFKINISGVDTMDLTTRIVNNTTAEASTIKYRLMAGDCGAMQERSCVQDGRTEDTYRCLPPGSYYLQIFTPVYRDSSRVRGTIDLVATVAAHAQPCAPINPCLASANFIPDYNCNRTDSVRFYNYSTYGYNMRYLWKFGYNNGVSTDFAPSFYYPPSASDITYNVRLFLTNSVCGGTDSTIVPVTIPGRPTVELGSDTEICTMSTLTLDASSWPGSSYLWQDNSTSPFYVVSDDDNIGLNVFHVRVTYNGCNVSDTVRVILKPKPDVTVTKSNDINCILGKAKLEASGGLVYNWTPPGSLSDASHAQTMANPTSTTLYQVIGTTRNGCSDTAYVTVNVDFSEGPLSYSVPSAFSPNNDGLNDCFGVPYWVNVSSFDLNVYNRWGQLLFHTSDPRKCWDGTFKGVPQEIGNYVYYLKGEGDCGPFFKKGNLVLIR